MKTRRKRIRDMMCAAVLLLALTVPPSAYGQSDGFFSNVDGARDGNYNGGYWNNINGGGNGGYWNNINGGGDGGCWNDINGNGDGASWNDINGGGGAAAWNGMEDETPVGGGLLVLTAAGACYAGIKRFRNSKIRQSKA